MSDAITRGRKALKRIFEQADESRYIYGTMGRLVNGVPTFEVTGRARFVYVTIRQANGSQSSPVARNDTNIPHALGLPIRLRMEGNTLIIDRIARRDDMAYSNPALNEDIHTHDNRYFRQTQFVDSSAGSIDSGKPAKLDANGQWDASLIDTAGNLVDAVNDADDIGAPVGDDKVVGVDSVTGGLGWWDWTTIQAWLTGIFNALYVTLTGAQTITGVKTFGDGTTFAFMNFNSIAGQVADFRWQTAGVDRWFMRKDGTAESGGNTGSLWALIARADDGSNLGGVITATRLRDVSIGGIVPLARMHILQSTLGGIVHRLQSTATNDDPIQDLLQDRVATTNATVTTLATIAIPASHACMLEAHVVARRTGGASGTAEDCAAYLIRGLFNQVAGAANIVAQAQTVIGESQAAWDCVFDVNGTDARVRVTGAAGNNITWHAHVFHRFLST